MSRRMWIVAVGAWVAVVIAGSGLTWFAIERAGDQVTVTPEAAETTQPPFLGTVGPAPSSAVPAPTRTRASRPAASPRTPTHATPAAPSVPQYTQVPAPTPTSRPPAPPVQPAQVRTWSGRPGSLTVSCVGRQVSFRSATPSNGWSFERGGSSGEDIEVTFKNGESEVQVRATCSGGVPQFSVESSGGGDG